MEKQNTEKIKELYEKSLLLDDVCSLIYVILLRQKEMRFNKLFETVQKFGIVKISKPTFSDHLKHLLRKKMVKRKKKDIQNVSYVLADELDSFEESENMKRWIDNTIGWKEVKAKDQDYEMLKRQYGKFTEKDLDRTIGRDLSYFLLNVLFELDTLVSYSLETRIGKNEDFWKFVGNPLYRLFQKSFVDNCRASPEYRKRFYEELDSMITKFKGEYEHGKI